MRTSRPNWSARPAERGREAAWRPAPRFTSGRRADARSAAPRTACAPRRTEQAPGRRDRRGAAAAGDRAGRAAGRARASPRPAVTRADQIRDDARSRRSAPAARGGQAARNAGPELARETYLEALAAALSAESLVRAGDAREIAAAVLAADWGPHARLRSAAGRPRPAHPRGLRGGGAAR